MVSKSISLFDHINSLTPYSIGFDTVFDRLSQNIDNSSYPPYNIRKVGEFDYTIELALAGFSKKDIEVKVVDGVITIKSIKENSEDDEALYRGISYRKFTKKFSLADDMEVKGAKLDNGLLSIDLERIVPEEKKPRTIDIK
tara:strand:+ start:314 stop:736 length:423 start_codon:yes stop_codon:yes gene_type:complete